MPILVAAFYKFVRLDDPAGLRQHLLGLLRAHGIKGTILLASEGINGTISGTPVAIAAVLADVRADPRFADLVSKDAITNAHPFQRLKVKVKREIISFRQPGADPTVRAGTYVAPEAWNALIAEPDVLVLDTRNAYEVAAGTFKGAVDPKTRHFGDFPDFVKSELSPDRHRRVAMFCTGGIRCEKASAYLLAQGFAEVYHLQGGILNYLARVPKSESRFDGTCFVFDARETIDGSGSDRAASAGSDPIGANIKELNVIPDKETPLSGGDAIREPAQNLCEALEISGPADASFAGSRITIGQGASRFRDDGRLG